MRFWLISVGVASLFLFGASAATAGQEHRGPFLDLVKCFKQCVKEHRACMTAPRQARHQCKKPCRELRKEALDTCIASLEGSVASGEPAPECVEARNAYRECVAPCRDAYRPDRRQCRRQLRTCLKDDCRLLSNR